MKPTLIKQSSRQLVDDHENCRLGSQRFPPKVLLTLTTRTLCGLSYPTTASSTSSLFVSVSRSRTSTGDELFAILTVASGPMDRSTLAFTAPTDFASPFISICRLPLLAWKIFDMKWPGEPGSNFFQIKRTSSRQLSLLLLTSITGGRDRRFFAGSLDAIEAFRLSFGLDGLPFVPQL